jgi:integrase/recombinase XerC
MQPTRGHALLKPRIEEFLSFCGARNLSQNTIRAYRSDLTEFVALVGPEAMVGEINRKVVRNLIVQLHETGAKRASTHRKLAAVKSFCRWLEQEELIEAGLIQSIPGPRRRDGLPDVPTEAELKRLFEGETPGPCPTRNRVIIELLYGAGLRASEVVGLNLADFREVDAVLIRGKGKKERIVIFGEYAQAAIREWLPVRKKLLAIMKVETDALLFSVGPHRSAERLEVRSIGRIVKHIAETKGLPPYNPHLLRHAFATHMHDHNAPLQAVATLLGHAKLSTAQIYSRVSAGRMMDVYSRSHPHA